MITTNPAKAFGATGEDYGIVARTTPSETSLCPKGPKKETINFLPNER